MEAPQLAQNCEPGRLAALHFGQAAPPAPGSTVAKALRPQSLSSRISMIGTRSARSPAWARDARAAQLTTMAATQMRAICRKGTGWV
jgi:hypothetical protein